MTPGDEFKHQVGDQQRNAGGDRAALARQAENLSSPTSTRRGPRVRRDQLARVFNGIRREEPRRRLGSH